MGHWLSHSLLRFKLIIVLIISCCFISCSSDTSSSFDDEISTISLSSIPDPNSYIIYVDGDQAGTATLSVTGAFCMVGKGALKFKKTLRLMIHLQQSTLMQKIWKAILGTILLLTILA